jgi:hypothetical protein
MPSGDPQRTWFPEMIASLRLRWHPAMSLAELIELRGELDTMLQSIRSQRAIVPPLIYCRHCNGHHRAASPRVSVRALLLSLARFGIASRDDARALEKSWKRYRESEQLDLYGQPLATPTLPDALHELNHPASELPDNASPAPPDTP